MAKTDNSTFEQKLFKSADKLRKNIDAAEYKHVVLGLIFLKYISESFGELYDKLKADEYSDPEDRDEYLAANTFFVPKEARWSHIHANAKLPTIGQTIDEAMQAIERENKELKNVLPQVYGRANLDKTSLGELIDLISNTELEAENTKSKDLFGRVYEYFLGEFANAEGKKGGQFYTPKSIVKLMVEMIEPYKGRVYDPASGSGGMFVMSEKFVTEHQGNIKDITVYGQESNQTTWKLSKMNLAIRNINSKFVAWNTEGTFLKDAHPDLKADYILANPPFNQSEWGVDILQEDGRWKYGTPPSGNANYGWMQHMLYHLAPRGVMATVLSNGSLSSNTSGEGEIRKNLIDNDLVECIVALPKQLFYNTGIPACIWFLRREKANHSCEILFIDASEMGYMKDRVHRDLAEEDLEKITTTYHNWRKSENYHNEKGFCKSATIEEIEKHNHVLTPGRYVGIEVIEDDGISFETKMATLNKFLKQNTHNSRKLDEEISKKLNIYFPSNNWNEIDFNSNEILELIAKTIFTEWFGKYKIDDELPNGWKVGKLSDLVEKISKGTTPTKDDLIGLYGEIPFLKVKDISNDGLILKNNLELIPKSVHNNQLKRSILETNDILFSIAGTIGRLAIVDLEMNNANCNQALAFIRLKDKYTYLEYIHLWLKSKETQDVIISNIVQGVQANVSLTVLGNLLLLIPNSESINNWCNLIKPIYKKLQLNTEQIQTLTKTRDELLPRLMSGEIRVNEFKN